MILEVSDWPTEEHMRGVETVPLGVEKYLPPDLLRLTLWISFERAVDVDRISLKGKEMWFTAAAYWDSQKKRFRVVLFRECFEGKGDVTTTLLHEVLHILYAHQKRGEGKNPILWNIATDVWVWETLRLAGHSPQEGNLTLEILKLMLRRNDLGYWSPEIYYSLLVPQGQEVQYQGDIVLPTDDPVSLVYIDAMQRDAGVQKALEEGGLPLAGSSPGAAPLNIPDYTLSPPTWFSDLLSLLSREEVLKDSRSWRREGRTPLTRGHSRKIVSSPSYVTVALDVSGSMGEEEVRWLNAFCKLLSSRGVKGSIIYFDTAVIKRAPLSTPLGELPTGGGGTDYLPPLKEWGEKGFLILATDGYPFRWPKEPKGKVAFVCTTKVEIPWKCPVFRVKEKER